MSVIDASALLALLNKEPGASTVAGHVTGGHISAVNAAEVASKLADVGLPSGFASAAISALGINVVDFDSPLAWAVGDLRPETRSLGLSLGDRACLALGRSVREVVVTADALWSGLSDQFEVLVIR